jgi:hypothetical protein
MPIFKWDAKASSGKASSDVVNERFWIYWAVTGPPTTITILARLVWGWWRNIVYIAKSGEQVKFRRAVARSLQKRGCKSESHPDVPSNESL